MSAACTEWEPIHGFRSPAEFDRFKAWIAARVEDGIAEQVAVDMAFKDANPMFEQWYRRTETGEVWRLIEPTPPSRGLFDRLDA